MDTVYHFSMLQKEQLEKLYVRERRSMKEISSILGCSVHKVQYWLIQYHLPRRTIGEAVYCKYHPDGDPFTYDPPHSKTDHVLFGTGIGLYWGEGTKSNTHSVRLGNTDPALLDTFLRFLERFFHIQRLDCRFGLQIFSDLDPQVALDYWTKQLTIHRHQFYKITVTVSGSLGTYRQKSRYGVLTIYYNNRKLRDRILALLPPATCQNYR